eukprot:scaffold117568_cov66-Phaeocystis_antarctica.AAC.2
MVGISSSAAQADHSRCLLLPHVRCATQRSAQARCRGGSWLGGGTKAFPSLSTREEKPTPVN